MSGVNFAAHVLLESKDGTTAYTARTQQPVLAVHSLLFSLRALLLRFSRQADRCRAPTDHASQVHHPDRSSERPGRYAKVAPRAYTIVWRPCRLDQAQRCGGWCQSALWLRGLGQRRWALGERRAAALQATPPSAASAGSQRRARQVLSLNCLLWFCARAEVKLAASPFFVCVSCGISFGKNESHTHQHLAAVCQLLRRAPPAVLLGVQAAARCWRPAPAPAPAAACTATAWCAGCAQRSAAGGAALGPARSAALPTQVGKATIIISTLCVCNGLVAPRVLNALCTTANSASPCPCCGRSCAGEPALAAGTHHSYG